MSIKQQIITHFNTLSNTEHDPIPNDAVFLLRIQTLDIVAELAEKLVNENNMTLSQAVKKLEERKEIFSQNNLLGSSSIIDHLTKVYGG